MIDEGEDEFHLCGVIMKVGFYGTSGSREGERTGVMKFKSKALIVLAVGERVRSS